MRALFIPSVLLALALVSGCENKAEIAARDARIAELKKRLPASPTLRPDELQFKKLTQEEQDEQELARLQYERSRRWW